MSAFNTSSSTLLSQGVSTAPRHVRLPGQVESSLNILYSVIDGASTRNGSRLVGNIDVFKDGDDFTMDIVVLSDGTEYAVVHGYATGLTPYQVQVYRVSDWRKLSTTVTTAARAYLNNAVKARDVRVRTSSDATFLVNSRAVPGLLPTPAFDVDFTHRDFDTLVSYTPFTSGTYHRTLRDVPLSPAGFWKHDDGGISYPMIQMVSDPAKMATEPGEGAVVADYTPIPEGRAGSRMAFRRASRTDTGVTWTQSTRRLTKTAAFTDFEIIDDPGGTDRVRTQIRVLSGTGITPGWWTVVAKISNDTIELAPDIGPDAVDVELEGERDQYLVVIPTNVAYPDMHAIARAMQDELRSSGAVDALVGWVELGADRGRFMITSHIRGTDRSVFDPEAPGIPNTHDLTDSLNTVRPLNFTVPSESTGFGTGVADGSTVPPEARWTRVAAPSDKDGRINPQTMPVLLVVVPATPPALPTVTVDVVEWNSRQSGTAVTNPPPDPIVRGEPIVDAMVIGGRLALGAGASVMFSADGDLFRYFVNDSTNLVDSDPFTVPLSGTRIGGVSSLASLSSSLTVFTSGGLQFEVRPPYIETQVTLSSSSAILVGDALPIRMGETILFAGPNGFSSSLYEYAFFDSAGTFIANDVSRHAFGLLPGTLTDLEATWSGSHAVAIEGDDRDFYVYHRTTIDSRRVQAAYAPCRIGSGGVDAHIRAISTVGDDLYVLFVHDDPGVIGVGEFDARLYRIPLSSNTYNPWETTAGPGYVPVLDGMVRAVGVGSNPTSFAYQAVIDGGTTLATVDASMVDTVVFSDGRIFRRGDPEWTQGSFLVQIAGDHEDVEAVMGSAVDAWLVPTPPTPRDQGGDPLFGTALAVNRVLLMIPHTATTANFGFTVTAQKEAVMDTLVGTFAGFPETPGVFSFVTPVRPEVSPYRIIGSTPKPMSVQSVWYDGQIVPRR